MTDPPTSKPIDDNESVGFPPANARELAFRVLDQHHRSGRFVARLLEEQAGRVPLPAGERRLAAEIVYGVVRRQATLNALLAVHLQRPRHRVEGRLWSLMQIGAYQLIFLSSVPPHAALHETVELARRIGRPQWTGFLNGVLRNLARSLTDDFAAAPSANAVPLDAHRYRVVDRAVFPDPVGDPAGYVAQALSFPLWLIERWRSRVEFAELLRLAFWFNTPPQLCLRANRLKATRETILEKLAAADVGARAGAVPESIWLEHAGPVAQLPGFGEGLFTVQDESAIAAARLLAPNPGEAVLDLCAAPGTKTTHLAELMENSGSILAADVDNERLALVGQNSRRLGIDIITTRLVETDGSDTPPGRFDAILVDAPCSNTGVLAKRPESRWRLQPQGIGELALLQRRLLDTARSRLKPGGRLVYSTCSIEPEENRQVVRALLGTSPELRLVGEVDHVPGEPSDGGYQALLIGTG